MKSLTESLEGHFDRPFNELPAHLQDRVKQAFLLPWLLISPKQKKILKPYLEALNYELDPESNKDAAQLWCIHEARANSEDFNISATIKYAVSQQRVIEPIVSRIISRARARALTVSH